MSNLIEVDPQVKALAVQLALEQEPAMRERDDAPVFRVLERVRRESRSQRTGSPAARGGLPVSNPKYFPPERVEPDVCLVCGFEACECLCPPASATLPTAEELERSRCSRLTAAELASQRKPGGAR